MSVNAKMKKICDNTRLRTGGTALLNLDQIADAIMQIGEATDPATLVYRTIGTTYPPVQNPGEAAFSGYDIDVPNALADDIHAYIDEVVSGKETVTKEIMGKDSSGKYDLARYTYANRQQIAWQKQNYPKMYAWKNGSAIRYTESVSPRIGDKAYDVPYVKATQTQTQTVTRPKFTNLKVDCVYKYGYRYSQSGGAYKAQTDCTTILVPVPSGDTAVTVRWKGADAHSTYNLVYGGSNTETLSDTCLNGGVTKDPYCNSDGVYTVPCTKLASTTYISFHLKGSSASDFTNLIVTVNEPIEYETVTEEVETEGEGGTPVTAVSATNRSRTIDGVEYVRYASGDVEPTVIYTALGDSRNSNTTITQDGIIYSRYPLGDLGANREKMIPIFIYANEHGVDVTRMYSSSDKYGAWETKMCALVAARFLRDLASGVQETNALYKFVKDHCMVIVIPVANPYGFNMPVTGETNSVNSGYYNYNSVNINRNYDCPGFVNPDTAWNNGPYPGSEIENQYIMNTMVESGAVVAMSLHGLGGWEGYCAHQGQSPDGTDYDRDKLAKVAGFLMTNYGYTLRYYDTETDGTPKVAVNMPDTTSKSPSYITQCGAYGGIVEFSPDDVNTSGWKQELKPNVIENAYAQMLNLTAMWLSDYLNRLK